MMNPRLQHQLDFLRAVDALKGIKRQTLIATGERQETDAEHSWHVALMAWVLGEYSKAKIDLFKVVIMLLIHDLVEIIAGDTYFYQTKERKLAKAREQAAAAKIFSLLPFDQAQILKRFWEEFEERKTPEAKFAAAMDRVQPIINNFLTGGKSWREHNVTSTMVLEKCRHIKNGAPLLWEYIQQLIQEAVEQGMLPA
ncbi:MAG: HD domain-containing protein [Candidatus Magasanikbacteria bacterium]|nr:HD domain-containing protein [Candidatus Magasanikbacteria bacterium]